MPKSIRISTLMTLNQPPKRMLTVCLTVLSMFGTLAAFITYSACRWGWEGFAWAFGWIACVMFCCAFFGCCMAGIKEEADKGGMVRW